MPVLEKRVTVICGHYGTGKTNLSLNLAIDSAKSGDKVTLIDMDIVNLTSDPQTMINCSQNTE
mgnify:CR=1 FL=1